MTSLITIWPDARPVGWTGEYTERGAHVGTPDKHGRPRLAPAFEPYPLRLALDVRYSTDAHFVPYVLYVDGQPVTTPRCNKSADTAIAAIGGELRYGCVALDCDDLTTHADRTPARPEWRRDWWRKVESLPFNVGAYETRGGGRIVAELPVPVSGRLYLHLLSGMHAFAQDAGLAPDRLVDLQRCYRLPFVTRDGEMQLRPARIYFEPITIRQQLALMRCGEQNPLVVEREVRAPTATPRLPGEKLRPGEYLARHVAWSEILGPAGGRFGGMKGDQEVWYRPGKKGNGPPSALTNYQGNGRLKVLTSNWSGFGQGDCVDKLGAIAAIEGVDIREATRIAVRRWSIP